MQKGTKRNLLIAATYAAVLFLGILLGQNYLVNDDKTQSVSVPLLPIGINEHTSKVQRAIDLISGNYVDSVDMDSLQHAIISELVSRLDPHSDYMPAQEAAQQQQALEGSFEGIGVEYFMLSDTLLVVGLVPDGPAEHGGLKVGDRVLSIDGTDVAGVEVTSQTLENLIKGRRGSTVEVSVIRDSLQQPVPLKIIRDQYELSSIDASYLLSPYIAYIRISNFGARTVQETRQRLQSLTKQGAKHLILDLRGNRGGFLAAGIDLAGLFLPPGVPIVYTQGTHDPRTTYTARNGGQFTDLGLAVLIDEESASASEILAGAIQDYERGTIIGRPSFGKGLIQERFGFGDGSVLNLTVARYYTPKGRSIQRPGGILPDIEIPADSIDGVPFFLKVHQAGLIHEFVYSQLTNAVPAFAIESFLQGYFLPEAEYEAFLQFLEDRGLSLDLDQEEDLIALQQRFRLEIEALLARYYFGSDAYFKTKNRRDAVVAAAQNRLEVQEVIESIEASNEAEVF